MAWLWPRVLSGPPGAFPVQRTEVKAPLGEEPFAIATGSADQRYPAVAHQLLTAEYLVVWQHDNGSDDDIHGQRVGPAGNLRGSELVLAAGTAGLPRPMRIKLTIRVM